MFSIRGTLVLGILSMIVWSTTAHTEGVEGTQGAIASGTQLAANSTQTQLPAPAALEPFRTFITVQRYTMEQNGEAANPVSNVRVQVTFPNGQKLALPEGNQWWPIGNGQVQEINRTFEIPFTMVSNDGFKFEVQMERKGSKMLPCIFDVSQLSQFNRAYTCHTDIAWQQNQKMTEDKLDREGIQVRVFTSRNSEPKDIPTSAIAIR